MNMLKKTLYKKIPLMKHIGFYQGFMLAFDYLGLNSLREKFLEDENNTNISLRLNARRQVIEERLYQAYLKVINEQQISQKQ